MWTIAPGLLCCVWQGGCYGRNLQLWLEKGRHPPTHARPVPQYKELVCPLDGFQLLLFSLGGADGKTYPLWSVPRHGGQGMAVCGHHSQLPSPGSGQHPDTATAQALASDAGLTPASPRTLLPAAPTATTIRRLRTRLG